MSVIKSFLLGILAAAGALVLETVFLIFFNIDFSPNTVFIFSFYSILLLLLSATTEETLKMVMAYKNADGIRDMKISLRRTLFLGLGFSLVEIVLYFLKLPLEKALITPYFGLIAIHTATALWTGFILAKNEKFSFLAISEILLPNISLHILYNLYVLFLA